MGNFLGIPAGTGAQDVPMFFYLSDWPEAIRQLNLQQLGLEGKWGIDPNLWDEHERAGSLASLPTTAYPFTHAWTGNAANLYAATPAYATIFESPVAMIYGLLHPKV